MEQFRCPLCGKFSVVEKYDPTNYENEIQVVEFKGLGRGKGFKKEVTLGDALSNPDLSHYLSRRALEIVKYFVEQQVLDQNQVIDEINSVMIF